MTPARSAVVTGAAGGIGAVIAQRLQADGWAVVVLDAVEPEWDTGSFVTGDAADEGDTRRALDTAQALAPLAGWVNNAAIFRDAGLDAPRDVLELVTANLAPAVVGSGVAVQHWRRTGTHGAIVNVSSHQAQRAVRGALPYATAKAAVEGLTRAAAVDHGRDGVRVNAVALGSIRTARHDALLAQAGPDGAVAITDQLARLHPLGRVGTAEEAAAVVSFLLSDAAAFVTGAVIPVDGGRAAQGLDPEQT